MQMSDHSKDNGYGQAVDETENAPDAIDPAAHAGGGAPAFDEGEIDPELNRVPQELDPTQGARRAFIGIPVRNPAKFEFFRVHPTDEFHFTTFVLERRQGFERVYYMVAPDLKDTVPQAMVARTLYLCCSKDGSAFVWPVRYLFPGEPDERYARTARACAERAKGRWLYILSDPKVGWQAYDARGDLGEPQWPETTLKGLLNAAFKGRYITAPDHPVFRELRGEQ
jgi:hypothetical protein